MNYTPTHSSRRDGSTAMMVSQPGFSIVLVNEDGAEWIDPLGWWIPIGEETDEDIERWEENEQDKYPPSQSGEEFMANYYNSDSYINYLNSGG